MVTWRRSDLSTSANSRRTTARLHLSSANPRKCSLLLPKLENRARLPRLCWLHSPTKKMYKFKKKKSSSHLSPQIGVPFHFVNNLVGCTAGKRVSIANTLVQVGQKSKFPIHFWTFPDMLLHCGGGGGNKVMGHFARVPINFSSVSSQIEQQNWRGAELDRECRKICCTVVSFLPKQNGIYDIQTHRQWLQ